jgi:hypothetical protein
MKRSYRIREFSASQRAGDLPNDVGRSVSRALQTTQPTVEVTCGSNERPAVNAADPEVAEFCEGALAKLLDGVDTREGDSAMRFTVHAIPVARIEYEFGSGRFSGYFVGQTKEFISHGEPLGHLHEQALTEHREELEAGHPERAIRKLLPTLEMAASDARMRPVYKEALEHVIETGRRRFERAGLLAGPIVALVAPTWLSLSGHLWGSGVAMLSALVPHAAARFLGLRPCLCDGLLAGGLAAATTALVASAWSWFLTPVWAVPMAILSLIGGVVGTVAVTRRYLTKLDAPEENLVTLITSENDKA